MLLGFLSDAHGNIKAFKKCLDWLEQLGCNKIYFLGDSIGYIPSVEVIEYLLQNPKIECLLGNHEEYLLKGNVEPLKDKVYQLELIKNKLTNKQLSYIKKWPTSIKLETAKGNLWLIHGSPTSPTQGYVYPDANLKEFGSLPYSYIFMGNTHRSFISTVNGTTFVNVGSCGMPRDTGSLASCATFNTKTGEVLLHKIDITAINSKLTSEYSLHASVIEVFNRK